MPFPFWAVLREQIHVSGLQTWYNDPRNALIVKSVLALAFSLCQLVMLLKTSMNLSHHQMMKLMTFYPSFLATLKRHRLMLYSVEDDKDQHFNSVSGTH